MPPPVIPCTTLAAQSGAMKRAGMLVVATFALGASAAQGAGGTSDEAMMQLAHERGCSICHSAQPVARNSPVPAPAPSWLEIASRYRGDAGAQARLEARVLAGTPDGKRHWQGHAAFASMMPNAPVTSSAEARDLVRWILAWP